MSIANRFWVGGNSTWDATAGTKWATTSGGVGGAAVPTAADDVFIDNGTGTGNVTLNANRPCNSLNFTGYVGTFTHNAFTLTIGSATAGATNIALKLVAGMTYTLANNTTSAISFISTSATVQTIDFAGKNAGNIVFNSASNGSFQFTGTFVQNAAATLTVTKCTQVDYNGQALQIGGFSSNNTNVRKVVHNGANIQLSGIANCWNTTTITSLTYTPDTGSITVTGAGSAIAAVTCAFGGLTTLGTWNFTGNCGRSILSGTGSTFTNLTIAPANTAQNSETSFANSMTVTGTLTLTGFDDVNRLFIRSNIPGASFTLSVGTFSSNGYVHWQDCHFSGTASPITNSHFFVTPSDQTTGITGATPITAYYVGGTGNFNDINHWASTTGGTGGTATRVPGAIDTAFLDANSGVGTITMGYKRFGNIDFTNTTLTAITWTGGFNVTWFCGDVILPPSGSCPITFGGFADIMNFTGRGSQVLKSGGNTMSWNGLQNPGGNYTLQDNLTASTTMSCSANGIWSAVTFNVTTPTFTMSNGTINMGSGTWSMTSTGTVWTYTSGTVNANTSTLAVTDTSATGKTVAGGGQTYYNWTIAQAGTGVVTLTGANTFNSIEVVGGTGSVPIKFTNAAAGQTTLTGGSNSFITGSAGNVPVISSTLGTLQFTLISSVPIVTDYISLQDSNASGGIPFYAGSHSTSVSNVTNWNFTDPPAGGELALLGVG